jgi:hypothetical protein
VNKTCGLLLAGGLMWAGIAAGQGPTHAGPPVWPDSPTVAPAGSPHGARIQGTVLTTADAGRYTYLEIDSGGESVWAAVALQEIEVGATVELHDAMPMRSFYSPTLDRRFDLIYFSSAAIVTASEPTEAPEIATSCPTGSRSAGDIDLTGIERAEGGHTVAELFENRKDLAGQQVVVRGVVVKCLSGIMGRNWLHLRDGTTSPDGEDELTITTDEAAAVGTPLLARGTVTIDKDFGHGYAYGVLLEDATLALE